MTKAALAGLMLIALPALATPAINIDTIAGLYSYSTPSKVSDSREANNVLEVVKLSATKAYVRTLLISGKKGICTFWGVTRVEGDALVWRDRDRQGRNCELHLHFSNGEVTFEDKGGYCDEECSLENRFEYAKFDAKSRRPILYMKRLLASRQYQDAVDAQDGK